MDKVHFHEHTPLRGEGTVIAIIDDGVCTDCDLLNLKYNNGSLNGESFVPGTDWKVDNKYGHGTLVASIIGGYTGKFFYGIAPRAEIFVCRVTVEDKEDKTYGVMDERMTKEYGGKKIDVTALKLALERIYDLKNKGDKNVDIVCMSLGLDKEYPEIGRCLELLHNSGVILIGAAGNEGTKQEAPKFPASNKYVLSVGALTPGGNKSDFTCSSRIDAYLLGEQFVFPDKPCNLRSGTSYAAPMLAGFLSLLIQQVKENNNEDILNKYDFMSFLQKKILTSHELSSKGALVIRPDEFLQSIIENKNKIVSLVKNYFGIIKDDTSIEQ